MKVTKDSCIHLSPGNDVARLMCDYIMDLVVFASHRRHHEGVVLAQMMYLQYSSTQIRHYRRPASDPKLMKEQLLDLGPDINPKRMKREV